MSNAEENNKAWPLALFLSIFCFDRLYLGQTKSGIIKLIIYGYLVFFNAFIQWASNFHIHVIFLFLFWTWYLYDIVRIVFYQKNISRVITSGKVVKFNRVTPSSKTKLNKFFSSKSKVVTPGSEPIPQLNFFPLLLISIVGGIVGLDRFCMGERHKKVAWFKALSLGGFGLLYVIDILKIISMSTFNGTVTWSEFSENQESQ